MSEASITLALDLSPAVPEALSALAEVLDLLLQLRERGLGAAQALPQPGGVDLHRLLTSRADQGRIVLEPSKPLLDFVAAFRALDVHLRAVDQSHEGPHA